MKKKCPRCKDIDLMESDEEKVFFCPRCDNIYFIGKKGTVQKISYDPWESIGVTGL